MQLVVTVVSKLEDEEDENMTDLAYNTLKEMWCTEVQKWENDRQQKHHSTAETWRKLRHQ